MNFDAAREHMVTGQVRTWDVVDDRVLETMSELPRELFIPEQWRQSAYADLPIPIGSGQRMFTPRMEGRILQAVGVKMGDDVLEIGAGSAYLSACLAHLGGTVTALEIDPDLAKQAEATLSAVEIERVTVVNADASSELPSQPYDVIVVGGAVSGSITVFETLLREGGRLFVVSGQGPTQTAYRIERLSQDHWQREALFETELPFLKGFAPAPAFEF
ncbi:MAG: protein-L-isoaspartate O-methyltransferase [Pseudomonadota bacterium]